VIFASYLGSLLMAGGYLAIGSCISALTKSQVIAFVVAAAISFLFTVSGSPLVLSFFASWAPSSVLDAIASFSFLTHFNAISRGVVDLRDLVFYASLIICFLIATAIVIDIKKAG
jgi:ABC-2 type transport system permease protein